MRSFDSGLCTVPVLVEDGKVIQVGWHGHGCVVAWGSEWLPHALFVFAAWYRALASAPLCTVWLRQTCLQDGCSMAIRESRSIWKASRKIWLHLFERLGWGHLLQLPSKRFKWNLSRVRVWATLRFVKANVSTSPQLASHPICQSATSASSNFLTRRINDTAIPTLIASIASIVLIASIASILF